MNRSFSRGTMNWATIACVLLLAFTQVSAQSPTPATLKFQIRGGHLGQDAYHDLLPKMVEQGMNSLFVPVKATTPEARLQMLNRWHEHAAPLGVKFFPVVSIYRPSDRADWPIQRAFVDLAGKTYSFTPCPNDPDFWQRKITDRFVEIAKWAVDKSSVGGIVVDGEMYGADTSVYPDACFCPDCRREIAAELKLAAEDLNLTNAQALEHYRSASAVLAERSIRQTRLQTHAVFPGCQIGGYIMDHPAAFYKGLVRAWGTPELPALVLSERTYETGFGPGVEEWQKRFDEWGAHVEMVGGLWINRVPAENVAEQLYHLASHTRGYFIYEMISLSDRPMISTILPDEGAPSYWQAIAAANAELDKAAATPGHVSSLQIRPFKLPPPGLAMDRWKPVEFPTSEQVVPSAPSDFRIRGTEQMVYLSAAKGDTVKLGLDVAVVSKKKQDIVAVTVVDPSGQVVLQNGLKTGGPHEVSFTAAADGAHAVFLKCLRYAVRIEASSHPWLMATGGMPVGLYQPGTLYLKTLDGARRATLKASVTGPGEGIIFRAFDSSNRELGHATVDGIAGQEIAIDLPETGSQVIRVTFEPAPNGTVDDVKLTIGEGFAQWIASSPQAAFPRQ